MVAGEKVSLFLELIWAHLRILITREKTLDDTTLAAEGKYPIDFTQPGERFVLSLHYNGSNSLLFVNGTKIHQFKTKHSGIKDYTLCLGNISKDFIISIMKKTGLKGSVNFFFLWILILLIIMIF